MNPKISIVSSAYRPQNWMDLYKSIGNNDIEFELVFAGPNSPDYELPVNFRFIKTCVKPTQCFEIAVRNATGDLVMCIADDCMFKSPRPLDRLYETYKTYNDEKILISCKFSTNGVDESHFAHRFDVADPDSPVMPVTALMSKFFFHELGGIDRNFIAVMWDLDIAMRVYALGGRVVVSDVFLDENKSKSDGSILCSEFWRYDRALLESLWTTNGKVHLNRRNPVAPFVDMNILTGSQGPRGRWRGSSPVLFEKFMNIVWWRNRKLCLIYFSMICYGIKRPRKYPKYARRILTTLFKYLNPAKFFFKTK